ncbi:hypothetical protein AQJ66_03450 [Streptomyces bungoensis]|uniref:Uncharacterized protein n=1 Tax=Streptomyces bungoensis TaxID=285568 RepID=A0A101TC35_9ACTN|nr:hypothetical protein [Streptomyces bungoensis]KUN89673.1 hypothetical protein AQJ66_03450 [Streptomyces bungoensis]
MASRASSEAPSAGTPVPVPSLPGLGTTWYRRGTRYWLRRAWTTVVMLLAVGMLCFMALAFYSGFRSEMPPAVRTVCDAAQVAGSCVTVAWGWVVQRRDHRRKLLDPPTPAEFRRARRAEVRRSGRFAYAGRGLLVLAAPVLPAFAAWCVGWFAAALTVREYPSEVGARRWLEAHTGQSGTS